MKNVSRLLVLGLLYLLCVSWHESVTAANGAQFGVRVLAAPQGGQITEQYYCFDPAAEVAAGGRVCSSTVTNDCLKLVRFFQFDAAGAQVNTVDVPWQNFATVSAPGPSTCPAAGQVEAKTGVPGVAGRYKRQVSLYARLVAVEADGVTEVENAPLASAFAKAPVAGTKLGVR